MVQILLEKRRKGRLITVLDFSYLIVERITVGIRNDVLRTLFNRRKWIIQFPKIGKTQKWNQWNALCTCHYPKNFKKSDLAIYGFN